MDRIDSHQHVFWHQRDHHGLVKDMDEQSIRLAWLLSWEIPPSEDAPGYHRALNPIHVRPDGTHPGIPLSDLLVARDRFPDRFLVGYCPNPVLSQAPRLLEAAVRMHGVQICGEWKFRVLFDDPRCLELYSAAGTMGLPVVLHLDVPYLADPKGGNLRYQPSWYGGTVDNLERALQACPETIFLGHAPGFWREISGDARADPDSYPSGKVLPGGRLQQLLDQYPNLHVDLSAGSALKALERDPVHALEFISKYRDRVLFARDDYGGALLRFLETLPLTEDVQKALFFQNAERILSKSDAPG